MLSEDEYTNLAHRELLALIQTLDELASDDVDCEMENDIVTLEFADDITYVINSHRAARQIWMAADRTAWHFDWVPESLSWVAKKNGDELWSAIRRVLSTKLPPEDVELRIQRPER